MSKDNIGPCHVYGCERDAVYSFWDSTHGEYEHFCRLDGVTLRYPSLVKRKLSGLRGGSRE